MKRKIVLYSILYLVISIASAFGAIKLSSTLQNGAANDNDTPPYQLTQIVNNISSSNAIDLEIDIEIQTGENLSTLSINAQTNIPSENENLNLEGQIEFIAADNTFNINFAYLNQTAYFDLQGNKIYFYTQDAINPLIEIVGSLISYAGLDLSSLSIDDILIMLKNFTEVKTNNQITLDIEVPFIGSLKLVTDLKYSLQEFSIPTFNLNDETTISLQGNIEYPQDVVVEDNFEGYTDITNIVLAATDLLTKDVISLDISAALGDDKINGHLDFELSSLNTKLSLDIGENEANLIFIKDTIYLEFSNIYLKFNIGDLEKLETLANEYLGIDLPSEFINALVEAIQNKDLQGIINAFNLVNFDIANIDFSSLDLSFLNNITNDGNVTTIAIEDFGKAILTIQEAKFDSLKIENDNFDLLLKTSPQGEIALKEDSDSYIDAAILIPTIENIAALLNEDALSGQIDIEFMGLNIPVLFDINLKDEIFANIQIDILGQQMSINFVDGMIYLQFSEIKLSADLNSILQSDNLISQIYNILNMLGSLTSSNSPLIDYIEQTGNGFIIGAGDFKIEVNNNENTIAFDMLSNLFKINGSIYASEKQLSKPTIDASEYENLNEYLPILESVIDFATSEKYYLNVNLAYDNMMLDGYIDIENGKISALLSLTSSTASASITILNDSIYLNFNDVALSLKFEEIDTLLALLNEYFGVNFSNADLINFITSSFDLQNILSGSTISLSKDGLLISHKDYLLQILFENNVLTGASFNFSNLNAKIDIQNEKHEEITIQDENYVTLTELVKIIGTTFDSLTQENVALNVEIATDNLSIEGYLEIDYTFNKLSLIAKINGYDLKLYLENEVIYLNYQNLRISLSLDQINSLCQVLDEKLGVQLPLDEIVNIYEAIKSGSLSGMTSGSVTNVADILTTLLTKLEHLKVSGDKLELSIAGIGNIILTNEENAFKSLVCQGELSFDISATDYQNLAITEINRYVSLDDIMPSIENFVTLLSNKNLYGSGNILIGTENVTFNFTINTLRPYFNVNFSIFNQNVDISFLEDTIYVEFLDSKLYFSLNDLDKLQDFISSVLELDFNINNVLEIINDFLDSDNNPNFITSLQQSENGFVLTLSNGIEMNVASLVDEAAIKLTYQDLLLNVEMFKQNFDTTLPSFDKSQYTDLSQILPQLTYICNYLKNDQINLSLSGNYDDFILNGNVTYSNSQLCAFINISQGNFSVDIMLYEKTIYFTLNNVNLKFDLNEIDLLSDFMLKYLGFDISSILGQLTSENFSIENILSSLSIDIKEDKVVVKYGDISALIDISKVGDITAVVEYEKLDLNISLSNESIVIKPNGSYAKLSNAINLIDSLFDFISRKQFDLGLTLKLNNDTIYGNFQFDLLDDFNMGGRIYSNTIDNMNIKMNAEDGWSYFNLNGLLLKMNNSSFKEMIYILLQSLGIDTSIVSIFDDVNVDLDFSGIQSFTSGFGDLTMDALLNLASTIKSIKLTAYELSITLDGSKLYSNDKAEDLTISLISNGTRVSQIKIKNLYSNSNLTDKMDIDLSIKYFSYVSNLDKNQSYYDISGVNDILKSVVNMARYRDFTLEGSMKIVGTLIGIDISYDVNYQLRVKILEDGKLELYGVVGSIPVIPAVNNDVPYKFGDTSGGSGRYLYIYYKDGYVYLYRTEKVNIVFGISSRTYEKATKVPLSHLLQNIGYYIQYALGLKDNIMDSINNSLNSDSGFINFADVLIDYSQNGSNYNFTLNMAEITGNSLLGNLNLGIGLGQDSEAKSYIKDISYNLYMPLSDTFSLTISSNNTSFTRYGKSVDMSPLYDFISSYKYSPYEEWHASDGSWSKAN